MKHIDAEDFLTLARPHLGLTTGETIGIDVSVSSDLRGKNVFVTGVADKVKLVENLLATVDVPKTGKAGTGQAKLQSHPVEGGSLEVVYNVLLTMLSGKDVRLSSDAETNQIVALATPDIQQEIAATIKQLQVADVEFAVIQLKNIDPYFAISLLKEMLELPDDDDESTTSTSSRYRDYDRDRDRRRYSGSRPAPKQPFRAKIDGDPANMRLFVRARASEIAQIKQIIDKLDVASGGSTAGSDVRILPIRGQQAERLLQTTARFWRGENPVIYFPPADADDKRERTVNASTAAESVSQPRQQPGAPKYLTDNLQSQAPPIRCQLTARGLVLQCTDTKALDKFEELLRTVSGPLDAIPSRPIVFYLKYTKASDALKMLAELLDGGEAVRENEVGSLVNGSVPSDGYLGSIVTSREGTLTMIADTITVVADTRLNRLIAQGTGSDIERIEEYLKIVDKDSSITAIETEGRSHVIELQHASASDVAVTIREVYAGRVAANSATAAQQRAGTAGRTPTKANEQKRDDGNDKNRKSANTKKPTSAKGQEALPQMTLAVHLPSNSLIVKAPEALFQEVEQLAKTLDKRSVQAIQVFRPKNGWAVNSMLQSTFSTDGSPTGGRETGTVQGQSPLGLRSPTGATTRSSTTRRQPARPTSKPSTNRTTNRSRPQTRPSR